MGDLAYEVGNSRYKYFLKYFCSSPKPLRDNILGTLMDTKIIKQSFALMQPHADRIVRRAFQLLEERNHATYRAFENSDMERQYSALTRSIAFIAYNIHNKERLIPYLNELGQRHTGYGVDSQSYTLLTTNLLAAMGECLGGTFSGEIKSEWEKTFHFVVSQMALTQAETSDSEENPSAETESSIAEHSGQQVSLDAATTAAELTNVEEVPAGEKREPTTASSISEQNIPEREGVAKVIHLTKEQLESYSLPEEIENLINEQAQAAFQQAIHEAWLKALSEQEAKFKELQSQNPFRKEA